MPSKIQLDENLWFLYICLQKSDMKSIDFTAVGAATSLKPPAARMRYTRLRRQIESGTLIGTHGTPFSSPAMPEDEKKPRGGVKKRNRAIKTEAGVNTTTRSSDEEEKKIKAEQSSEYESDTSGMETDSEESEDEMPLAKLSKKHMAASASRPTPARDAYSVASSVSRDGQSNMSSGAQKQYIPGSEVAHRRQQAELQALIPVGRVEFGGGVGGSWEENGQEGGFWSQRYEKLNEQRVGMAGVDVKPRKSF